MLTWLRKIYSQPTSSVGGSVLAAVATASILGLGTLLVAWVKGSNLRDTLGTTFGLPVWLALLAVVAVVISQTVRGNLHGRPRLVRRGIVVATALGLVVASAIAILAKDKVKPPPPPAEPAKRINFDARESGDYRITAGGLVLSAYCYEHDDGRHLRVIFSTDRQEGTVNGFSTSSRPGRAPEHQRLQSTIPAGSDPGEIPIDEHTAAGRVQNEAAYVFRAKGTAVAVVLNVLIDIEANQCQASGTMTPAPL